MQNLLMDKLRAYLVHNNPEVLIALQGQLSVTQYLQDKVSVVMPMALDLHASGKPGYVIEELCMNALTEDLRPSKFYYLKDLLDQEFNQHYLSFREAGVLTYELVNLIEACKDVFETFAFQESNADDRHLRYAMIKEVHQYLLG